jgi:hypothetical protein
MQELTTPQAAPEMVRMTPEEWAKTHRDFKGTFQGQRYVLRMSHRGTAMVPVQIVKEKK